MVPEVVHAYTPGYLARSYVLAKAAQAFARVRSSKWGARGLRWAPELSLFLLGVLLRLSMRWSFDFHWGYDSGFHYDYIRYLLKHGELPAADAVFSGFHPPLYYLTAAALLRWGADVQDLLWIAIVCGIIRLALVWVGLEWYVKSRVARLAALTLAAVLPVSVHIDGQPYPEPISCMLSVAALLFVPKAFNSCGWQRWRYTALIGALLGVQLLAKISALIGIATIGLVAGAELLLAHGRPVRERLLRLLPWSLLIVLPLLITGWYYARNVREHGKPFVTSFDLKTQLHAVRATNKIPLLDRRSLGYVVGFSEQIYEFPYWPTDSERHPRFWPVLIGSTFVDYYNYSFSGLYHVPDPPHWSNHRPLTRSVLAASRYSMLGGTVIALAAAAAWVVYMRRVCQNRDWGMGALVALPAVALAAALHFSIKYPIDVLGVTKAAYVQFASAPLFALFGSTVAWSSTAKKRWPLLALLIGALWLVATYTLYCRLRVSILPLGWIY